MERKCLESCNMTGKLLLYLPLCSPSLPAYPRSLLHLLPFRPYQLAAVQSLVRHLTEGLPDAKGIRPPSPNEDTWDLLIKAHINDKDCDGLLVALNNAKASGVSWGGRSIGRWGEMGRDGVG